MMLMPCCLFDILAHKILTKHYCKDAIYSTLQGLSISIHVCMTHTHTLFSSSAQFIVLLMVSILVIQWSAYRPIIVELGVAVYSLRVCLVAAFHNVMKFCYTAKLYCWLLCILSCLGVVITASTNTLALWE